VIRRREESVLQFRTRWRVRYRVGSVKLNRSPGLVKPRSGSAIVREINQLLNIILSINRTCMKKNVGLSDINS